MENEQINEMEIELLNATDQLRANFTLAAVYKDLVLALI